jgi:hypothetical protein
METGAEQNLKQLILGIETLRKIFIPYSTQPTVMPIMRVINQCMVLAVELGEKITNDPNDHAIQLQLNELSAQVAKMYTQLTEKDKVIARLEAELKKHQGS